MARFSVEQKWLLPILLLVMAVLVTVLTMLSPNQPNTEPLADRSIYNTDPTGYRAWYLASQKAGIPMLTWQKSFAHLNELPAPATMLMVEPYAVDKNSVLFGEKEVALLLKWVEQGNTLLMLDNFNRFGSSYVSDALSIQLKPADPHHRPADKKLLIVPPKSILSSYVQRPVVTNGSLVFSQAYAVNAAGTVPNVLLETTDHQPMMIRVPYGKGAIILGTTGDLGANGFLHAPSNDNYQFLSNLLIREQKPVYINEFVHGYVEAGDLLSYYQRKTPLGPIFGQLVLGFILLLWLSFARWTPKPSEAAESLSTDIGSGLDAYIHSLASIYTRTQASPLAVAPLLHRIEVLLRRKFRITLEDGPEEEARLRDLLGMVFAAYSNKDEGQRSALEALRKAQTVCRTQQKLQSRELLRLVQELTSIEERLRHHGQQHHALRR